MVLPFAGATEVGIVGFDPDLAVPSTYRTSRFKGTGPTVGWRVDLLDWGRAGTVVSPRRIVVTWADDPGPWLDLRFTAIRTGVDVHEALARARAALVDAKRSVADG